MIKIAVSLVFLGSGAGLIFWQTAKKPAELDKNEDNTILAKSGIHWHSQLVIHIKEKEYGIPAGIGLGAVHQPVHTHENDGKIHMEFPKIVRAEDLKLKQFFKNWDKKFDENCVFDYCRGEEGKLKMLVNGRENLDFENHVMKDGEKIEIIYE